ncbi:ketosteroid isomerase-related protein [Frigidibacter sp. MR17.14]|uniref:ketosteroid isomerase-related protein n=1 Tax=Frigidibacter sp. MR17.14 TaxID=3126509 RepID=UPI003012ABCC
MQTDAKAVIAAYYAAFNAGNAEGMLALLDDSVEHHVNEGGVRKGKGLFTEFCGHMGVSYRETLTDIQIFSNAEGTRAAAEFIVNGEYLKTDPGLPEARGQKYILPAGTFFALTDGKITRVTTYYNLSDWVRQVSEAA